MQDLRSAFTFLFCKSVVVAVILKKYAALMEIDWGLSNKDLSKKFIVPKNTLSTWEKNRKKTIAAFKSSGGAKRQWRKEGTYKQVNLVC